MRTPEELKTAADYAAARLQAGERLIVSGGTLDALGEHYPDLCGRTASAWNELAMGTQDTYVAWACESAKPPSLRFDTVKMCPAPTRDCEPTRADFNCTLPYS